MLIFIVDYFHIDIAYIRYRSAHIQRMDNNLCEQGVRVRYYRCAVESLKSKLPLSITFNNTISP